MPAELHRLVFDTEVKPHWFTHSDRFWFSYKTTKGTGYYLVQPIVSLADAEPTSAEREREARRQRHAGELQLKGLRTYSGTSRWLAPGSDRLYFIIRDRDFRLWAHYVGHDDNRDWVGFTQAETRHAVRLINEWHPPVALSNGAMSRN